MNDPIPEKPVIRQDLVDYLQYLYPDKVSREPKTSFELGEIAGVQNLIDHLLFIMNSKT